MRLIDADKLMQDLADEMLAKALDMLNYDNVEYMINRLASTPTAFDVDKVARQLEKECVKHRINVAETNFCPPPRIINEYDYGISEGIMRAIEIVKAGEV